MLLSSIKVLLLLTTSYLAAGASIRDIHDRIKRQTDVTCSQADIVFVIDSSGSIGEENWKSVLNFTSDVVESFGVGEQGARFGLVKYGNQASVEFYLDQYTTVQEYMDHILDMKWLDQETNTSGGIYMMYNDVFVPDRGDRPDVPNVGIVITDGAANRDELLTIPTANIARSKGITMFALGIGPGVNEGELRGIANPSGIDPNTGENITYAFTVIGFEALDTIKSQLVRAACEAAAVCTQIGDITFVLDGSGSVRRSNFELMKTFINDILNEVNIAADESHVAAVTFSSEATLIFNLQSKSESRATVQDAIRNITYPGGTTKTYLALDLVRSQVYGQAGDRSNVMDIVILFTDGGSDNFAETILAAKSVRLDGIYILVVAVTNMVNEYEVAEIASDPDNSNVFMANDFSSLGSIQATLKRAICNDADECSNQPCGNSGTCIDGINIYFCQCAAGWAGSTCEIPCPQPKDIAFVMDASPSIGQANFYQMQTFIKLLVYMLPIDSEINSRFGLETYASTPQIEFPFNQYRFKKEIMDAISLDWKRSGSTNTGAALRMLANQMYTLQNGDSTNADNVAILMSDGHSVNRSDTFSAALAAKDKGITMLTIGMGVTFKLNIRELEGISSDPDADTMFLPNNITTLMSIATNIVQAVCNDEDNCSPNPCNGGQCIDKIGSYQCICQQGRSGYNCERQCDGRLDIVFLVDNSGSIRRIRFEEVFKPVLQAIINNTDISSDRTRVGLATFSDAMNMIFQLNTYSRKEDVIQAIELIDYKAGRTNVADALMTMRSNMFTTSNGDRDDVPNICVMLTDGVPTMNVDRTLPEAIAARQAGIHMIVVAAEMSANHLYLKALASDPDSANIIAVDRFSQLLGRVNNIVSATCDDQNECSPNPCQNNGQCFNGLSQFICTCTDQFTGRNCERQCTNQRDVVLILDTSGSMDEEFDLMLQLSKEIVYGLNFKGSRARVGFVTFNNTARARFYLNEYTTKESVLNAIAFLQESGRTNIASALTLADQTMFTPPRGDRNGVDNFAVLMTDGMANINPTQTVSSATTLKNGGVRLMSVGFGTQYNLVELNAISSNPDSSNTFILSSQQDVTTTANRILDQMCQ